MTSSERTPESTGGKEFRTSPHAWKKKNKEIDKKQSIGQWFDPPADKQSFVVQSRCLGPARNRKLCCNIL
jgi:hypothetical protein